MLIPKSLEMLEYGNCQFMWSTQTVVLPESDSAEEVFLTLRQSSFGNFFGPSSTTDFRVSRPTSHIANQNVRG